MYWLRKDNIFVNLIIMSIAWIVTSYNFYLIVSMNSRFENFNIDGISLQISEIAANASAVFLLEKFGPRRSLKIAFGISCIGGLMITLYGLQNQDSLSFLVQIMFAKFGISCSFCIVYVINVKIFPTLFAATAFGFCNFIARLMTMLSPLVGQLDQPTPMVSFIVTTAIACVMSSFLREQDY